VLGVTVLARLQRAGDFRYFVAVFGIEVLDQRVNLLAGGLPRVG
jgi:hypothetical protein